MDDNTILRAMRYEYRRASSLGLTRLTCSFLIIVPPVLSLLDQQNSYVYLLSALSFISLVAWLLVDRIYVAARDRSLATRRALMVSNGTGEKLHPTLREDIREVVDVSSGRGASLDATTYYWSQSRPGPERVVELVEESAFYSERTHSHSGMIIRYLILSYSALFLIVILATIPTLATSTLELIMRFFMIAAAFFLSGDLLQRATQHFTAAADCRRIQQKCLGLLQGNLNTVDALLLLSDYFGAMEGAQETLPFSFSAAKKKQIEVAWEKRKSL